MMDEDEENLIGLPRLLLIWYVICVVVYCYKACK